MAEPPAYCEAFRQLALNYAWGIDSVKASQVPRIGLAEWQAIAAAAGTARQLAVMMASDHEALHDLRKRLRIERMRL